MLTSRRSLFGVLAAAVPGVALAVPGKPPSRRSDPVGYVMDAASMIRGEAGFFEVAQAHSESKTVRCYLDGVEQEDVEAASAVWGWVRRCKHNAEGNVYATPDDKIAWETVYGFVTIYAEPSPPAPTLPHLRAITDA